jgi:hypothetical protein
VKKPSGIDVHRSFPYLGRVLFRPGPIGHHCRTRYSWATYGTASCPGDGQVTLSCTAPADGGDSVDHYLVYQDDVELGDQYTGTSAVITGLTSGPVPKVRETQFWQDQLPILRKEAQVTTNLFH